MLLMYYITYLRLLLLICVLRPCICFHICVRRHELLFRSALNFPLNRPSLLTTISIYCNPLSPSTNDDNVIQFTFSSLTIILKYLARKIKLFSWLICRETNLQNVRINIGLLHSSFFMNLQQMNMSLFVEKGAFRMIKSCRSVTSISIHL